MSKIQARHKTQEFDVVFRTNKEGYPGPDIEYEKPKSRIRIMLLGDSFIEAMQVNFEDSITFMLQKELKNKGLDAEAINMAIGGYSPMIEYKVLDTYAPIYQPDIVLQFIFFNDITDDAKIKEKKDAVFDTQGLPIKFKTSFSRYFRAYLLNNFMVYRFYHDSYKFIKDYIEGKSATIYSHCSADFGDLCSSPTGIFKEEFSQKEEEAWQDEFRYLKGAADWCKTRGIGYMLIVIPMGCQVSKDEFLNGKVRMGFKPDVLIESKSYPGRFVAFAEENQIEYIDLLPIFKKIKETDKNLLYFSADGHLSGYGHQVLNDIVCPKVAEMLSSK